MRPPAAHAAAARYRAVALAGARSILPAVQNRTDRRASAFDHSSTRHFAGFPTHVRARGVAELSFVDVCPEQARQRELFRQKRATSRGKGGVVDEAILSAN